MIDNTSNILVAEVDIEEEMSYINSPAVPSTSRILLVDDTKVIGKVRFSSGSGYVNGTVLEMSVEPDDDATRSFFKDDIGWIDGYLYSLRYSGLTGKPIILNPEDEGRHKGTRIVGEFYFDMGIAHPSFSHIEGYGDYHKRQNRLRIHTQRKVRRPRNSHKIRKVLS